MILVADSGSTSTTWVDILSGNKIVTAGLNPHFTDDTAFMSAFAEVSSLGHCDRVFFYGAGCGDEVQRMRVARLLKNSFHTDIVAVETDLLGACRAACADHAGLVGILGTGSNACFYDGHDVAGRVASTGYVLGDHGSGNHLGRLLLHDYLVGVMPSRLAELFQTVFPYSYSEWMDRVYHQPHANRFLASLAPFAVRRIDDEYCKQLILRVLDEWFDSQLALLLPQTGCRDLYLVGGIAAAVEPLLKFLMNGKGIDVRGVLADPVDGLCNYHMSR